MRNLFHQPSLLGRGGIIQLFNGTVVLLLILLGLVMRATPLFVVLLDVRQPHLGECVDGLIRNGIYSTGSDIHYPVRGMKTYKQTTD